MARGDMGVTNYKVGTQTEILNRLPFEGVPMTIDFSSVSDTDADTGEKVVKAGTPINQNGAPQKTTPFTGAVGILLHDVDVTVADNNGAILLFGFVNTNRIDETTKAKITADVKKALPMIKFAAC